MNTDAKVHLMLFGVPTLWRADTNQEARLSPQTREVLGIIMLEGIKLSIAAERLSSWLWGEDFGETNRSDRLDRLISTTRRAFSSLGVDPKHHLARDGGVVRLVDVEVDALLFEIAYARKEYAKALDIASRGALLDGLRSGWANDWKERARARFGTLVDGCYRKIAEQLAAGESYDLTEIISVLESRVGSAVAYDLPDEAAEAREVLEKLRALRDAPRALDLPSAPRPSEATHAPEKMPLERLLVRRLGSGLSLEVDPEHVDSTHYYTRVMRLDLLDYPTGDFYSVRRLRGVNASSKPSVGLIYAESSEVKLFFPQTMVRAFDTASRKPLTVESLLPDTVSLFQHGFRIFFPRPLAPREEFDIVYTIKLPSELTVLSPVEEIMSIALVRWQLGVKRLEFRVCLNFEPRAVAGEYFAPDGTFVPLDDAPSVAPYTPEEWYERDFNIPWSSEPCVISYAIDDPTAHMYTIRYRIS